ncbi:MAG TPA: ABC transporter substrate-binding protein [Burkholderiaceae bacterium]|jgi:branched-chain amino acid transport system substrate-binding protein|nr:ABC transporter substrate-binding protein [Burkholderiaceae bacterium]HPL78714.1 ABC transporter substrate-binding protein [Burkholderiaceae bacterium]
MNLPHVTANLRNILVGVATALLASTSSLAEPGVTNDAITLGQTTALSGPLGDLGQEVLKGSKAYFDALNARGGINGRKIVLISKDDAYDPKKTVENVEAFIAGGETFALFGTFGTPNNEALIPVALKAGMPVLMPYTGAPSIRKPELVGVFNLRASYADEAEKLIQHLTTIGFKKIGIAYQNNSFGKEVLTAATAALEQRQLKPVAAVSVENNASDAAAAATKLLAAQPDALVLGLAGKPTIEVIKNVNQSRKGLQMYALSVLATAGNLKALGNDGSGVAISQVVPFPSNTVMPLVRDYQQAMKAAGVNEFSHLSLEGYLNARVVAEGIRRAGRNLSRESLITSLQSINRMDMGGMEIGFGKGASSASKFVELTVINSQGRLVK